MAIIAVCFGAICFVTVAVLWGRWFFLGRKSATDGVASQPLDSKTPGMGSTRACFPGLGYFVKEFQRPIVGYGVVTLALFFSVYGSRLVVVKMVLALCYAFVIARVFLRSDPR